MISEITGEVLYVRIRRNALLLATLLVSALSLGAPAPQEVSPEAGRTISIAARQGRPSFSLRISASGAQGRVEVRGASGAQVQSLTCSLLRDEAQPTAPELEAVRQEFVLNFKSEDLNFDGYADLKGPREFGAKWARYCVWLFDTKTNMFVTDYLAEQMELLDNLEADPKRRLIVAYSMGPTDPLMDEYRIEEPADNRPYWPRLIPVDSCFVANTSPGVATAFLTQYDQGKPVIKHRALDPQSNCLGGCDCVRPAVDR
ncbi:MAG TPA: hypothetical protein VMT20_18835 [Terriglobia bacterium]|nr:hypothetical protein [Terriglobia bacterium]